MHILWEKIPQKDTHFGFYLDGDNIVFRYSGPFDTNTGEWTSVLGHFEPADFIRSIRTLERKRECIIKGARDQTLRLTVLPAGSLALSFVAGYGNNISISDLETVFADFVSSFDKVPTSAAQKVLANGAYNP
jgi:metallophosphoesterase superfamily enzyme